MSLKPYFLFTALAVICIAANYASAMDGFASKCPCVNFHSDFIKPRHYKRIEIIPAGSRCRHLQILVTMKSNNVVCVDPNANWISDVIAKLKEKKNKNESLQTSTGPMK